MMEFDGLATPDFLIPLATDAAMSGSTWTEKVRAVFSAGWAVPGVAFAGLIVASVFAGVFVLSGDRNNEIAGNVGLQDTALPTASTGFTPGTVMGPEQQVQKDSVQQTQAVTATISTRVQRPRAIHASSTAVRRAARLNETFARNSQKEVPRLNGYTDEEDTSLRLAELFDDLESRN
jgi:hypothetical protein